MSTYFSWITPFSLCCGEHFCLSYHFPISGIECRNWTHDILVFKPGALANWAKSIFCFRWVFLKDEVHRLFLATFWVVYKTSPSYFCQLRLLVLLTFVFTFGFPNITKDIRDQLLPVLANLPNWSTYPLSDFHPKSRLSTPTPQLLQSFLLSERIKAPL